MKTSQLKKASELVERLTKIDAEIKGMIKVGEDIAMRGASGKFDLYIEKVNEDAGKKDVLDGDGSIRNEFKGKTPGNSKSEAQSRVERYMNQMRAYGGLTFFMDDIEKVNEDAGNFNKALSAELSDTAALSIMGILLEEKQRKRADIIGKLREIGFTTID